ncbi:hypothetical protein ACH3XW_47890 [Acanthocheilonema viteae]
MSFCLIAIVETTHTDNDDNKIFLDGYPFPLSLPSVLKLLSSINLGCQLYPNNKEWNKMIGMLQKSLMSKINDCFCWITLNTLMRSGI